MREYRFANCTVRRNWDTLYQETIFEGVGVAPALCVFGPSAYDMAEHVGYERTREGVIEAWSRHDLLHTIVAEARGEPYSPTLYGVAAGKFAPRSVWKAEEARVFSVERYLLIGREDELTAGLDLEAIRVRLADVLSTLEAE